MNLSITKPSVIRVWPSRQGILIYRHHFTEFGWQNDTIIGWLFPFKLWGPLAKLMRLSCRR